MSGAIDHLEREQARHRAGLIRQARSLADHLARLADNLEARPETPISELGELQSQATMFDARCASYCQVRSDLRAVHDFAAGLDPRGGEGR